MRKCDKFKSKIFLFLVAAILILCTGFFIVGCGVGPTTKASNPDAAESALNFNEGLSVNVSHADFPSIAGTELTIEAWVKPLGTSTSARGVFGRYDSKGALLWVKNVTGTGNNVPKFAIRIVNAGTGTSTDYTVNSGVAMPANGSWYHIAGVLTSENHTSTTSHIGVSSGCTTAKGQGTHLDIYVNGVFRNCATVIGAAGDTGADGRGVNDPDKFASSDVEIDNAQIGFIDNLLTPRVDGNASSSTTNFPGYVDEVRLWKSARTATQISKCKDMKLSYADSDCNVADTALLGYWKLNEGSGSDVYDSSGNGVGGSVEKNAVHYEDGWVTGKF